MYLVNHGGHCCGVKHIYGMNLSPTSQLPKLPAAEDFNETKMWRTMRAYIYPRPAETCLERLKAYIDFVELRFPQHVVEVVIANHGYAQQVTAWDETLLKLGFKRVNENINSNSKNNCVVYHLNVNVTDVPLEKRIAKCRKTSKHCFIPRYKPPYQMSSPTASKAQAQILLDGGKVPVPRPGY